MEKEEDRQRLLAAGHRIDGLMANVEDLTRELDLQQHCQKRVVESYETQVV